ncbi:RT0821/Lpp0805 family surface protein [Leisingera sp. ANG-DT]|uniref:RT0821/Lpp0805 family surface protein n=1 Tax=Leisingera sp. ANG-DT TaxID=1577897 RepID=UPI00126998C5|nr:RT0821/Lpp0805 family surface protein [Leisingera sp. ANG-DT]
MRPAFLLRSLPLLCALALPHPALAGGPSIKVQDKGNQYKYEYKDHRCQFKYHLKYGKGDAKTSTKGDCSHIAHFPQFAPPAAYARGSSRPAPQPASWPSCNSQALGRLLGGAAGAAAGSRAGDGDPVTIAAGTVLGALLGGEIGRRLGADDRRCIGSALEYAGNSQVFDFSSPQTGLAYALRPLARSSHNGTPCRSFDARFDGGSWRRGLACREGGEWRIVSLD